LTTEDGGEHWEELLTGQAAGFFAVFFADAAKS
jgi:hypothetical protein